jgi:hypothetical protein
MSLSTRMDLETFVWGVLLELKQNGEKHPNQK